MAIKVNEKRCIQKVNKFLSMLCKQLKVVKARVEDCRDVGKNGTGLTRTRTFENVTEVWQKDYAKEAKDAKVDN